MEIIFFRQKLKKIRKNSENKKNQEGAHTVPSAVI
jgi:hypothetical protein